MRIDRIKEDACVAARMSNAGTQVSENVAVHLAK